MKESLKTMKVFIPENFLPYDSSQKSEIDFAVMEERLVMWGQGK